MQLFIVSRGRSAVNERALVAAVSGAAAAFPALAGGDVWSATSKSGDVAIAAVHHPDAVVGPRTYRARAGDVVVLYDGLPVDRSGRFRGHDAAALLAHWRELPERLEGQYAAVRIDLVHDDVSLLADTIGTNPLFALAQEDGYLAANSVEAIRLASGVDAPSPLGVSSYVYMGWAVGDTTLLSGIRALGSGCRYELTGRGLVEEPYVTPATVANRAKSNSKIRTEELVTSLIELTASALSTGLRVKCALTAGRDTRVVLALLRACDARDVEYYTIGRDGEIDVDVARDLASKLGLSHEVWPPTEPEVAGDWIALTKMFVSQTDGLSSLIQIADYVDQLEPVETIGLKAGGFGGEIGRTSINVVPYASNVPVFTMSQRLQELLLSQWSRDFRGLCTPEAGHLVREYLHKFIDERRAEGWPLRTVSESFYIFDRMARWGAMSLRRTSNTDDVFFPLCSQVYVNHAFGVSPEERFLESPHYQMLSNLSPELRDLQFATPWKPQQRFRAPLIASASFARLIVDRARLGDRIGLGRLRPSAPPAPVPHWATWFDDHAQDHLELCLAVPDSPLWTWIHRAAVEQAFRAEPAQRAALREGLLRVATLFWYFHGRHLQQ